MLNETISQTDWLRRDAAVVAQSPYPPPLVFERGRGCELWDVEGRRYLDFESGQFCMSTGHSHPAVTEVIARQSEQLMQIGNRFTNVPRILLAEKLSALVPDPLRQCFFCSTGSEANETAIRIAKLVTGRFEIIALTRGYHGRTSAAFSLSSASRRVRAGFGPVTPGTMLIPAPYALRCPFNCGDCDMRCFDQAVELIDRSTSGAPAAVIVEPIIGAGGIIQVPTDWMRAVRDFCNQRGALLIADEALTGLGRTGRWFAFEHSGIVPDLVVTSKALGGGVPTAAIITTPSLAQQALDRRLIQAASHQGDPFQCAVALANIEVMEREALVANAQTLGTLLGQQLHALVARQKLAIDARGIGLIHGLEIAADGLESPELAAEVALECMARGLLVGGLRPGVREGNTLRLAPPLMISEGQIMQAITILDAALSAVMARRAMVE